MTGRMEVLSPREVPLGGLRAMTVRRTLPQRQRTFVGAWCFVDHYGPDDVDRQGGMVVPPHPHTGLQTASWLFSGEIEHRDSAGHHAFVRPGELNLMTAGRGISHSEYSTPGTTVLHGAQLWLALPDSDRHTEPDFEHHVPDPSPETVGRRGSSSARSWARPRRSAPTVRCWEPSCGSGPVRRCRSRSIRRTSTACCSTPAASPSATRRSRPPSSATSSPVSTRSRSPQPRTPSSSCWAGRRSASRS